MEVIRPIFSYVLNHINLLKDAFSLVRHNRFKQLNNFIDKNEIEVDEQDDKGNTMLLVACQNGHKRMAKIVLRRGANINIQNYLGNTPLHFCFQYGFAKLGAYLITKGADPEIRNNNGFLCTEGLGRNALLTFNQAIEERQRIVEERNLDEGQDWDDGASSVGCLTDRSDFNDGQLTDRSIVMTDRSNYDGFDNNLNGFGLETFTEGVEEETAAEEEYYSLLSEASKISLDAQGGPFTKEEAEEFIKKPHMKEAVELRRLDDEAKILNKKTPNLFHFKHK